MSKRQASHEPCPVPNRALSRLYRATPEGLAVLIKTVPPQTRAALAMYCSRRAHLSLMGLAIAARCDKQELYKEGSAAGLDLFKKSRAQAETTETPHLVTCKKCGGVTELAARALSGLTELGFPRRVEGQSLGG